MDMEQEARGTHAALLKELGIPDEDTRMARPPTAFEIAGAQINDQDTRGVAGNVVEFDGNLGLIIGAGGGSLTLFDAVRGVGRQARELLRDRRQPLGAQGGGADEARALEAGRREDRRDDERRLEHARRHHGARRHQGRASRRATTRRTRSPSSASPARGRKRARRSSSSTASSTSTARSRCTRRRGGRWRRCRGEEREVEGHPHLNPLPSRERRSEGGGA